MKALMAVALVLLVLHPLALMIILALELTALIIIGAGCWRASGISHRRRAQRWQPWMP